MPRPTDSHAAANDSPSLSAASPALTGRRAFLRWSGATAALGILGCRGDELVAPTSPAPPPPRGDLNVTVVTKTVKPSGGDYTSLSAAVWGLQAQYANLVALNTVLRIECYAMNDTTAVHFDEGWVTDADRYIHVVVPAAERHHGTWDAAKYVLSSANDYFAVSIATAGVRLEGLQIENRSSDATGGASGVRISQPGLSVIDSCIIRRSSPVATTLNCGVALHAIAGTFQMRNSVIYNYQTNLRWSAVQAGATLVCYNNTLYGSGGDGLYFAAGAGACTARIKNTLSVAHGSGGADFAITGGAVAGDYARNLSSDATAPGTDAVRGATVQFQDAAGRDLHLASSDTAARNAGADLSADATLPFSTDIDGETRQAPWDIGADERAGAAPGTWSATLPQAFVSTTYSRPANVTPVPDTGNPVTNGNNLKSAYQAATAGTVLTLTNGAVYDVGAGLTLESKAGSGWVYIEPANMSGLPSSGVRVQPSHASQMPTILCSVTDAKAVDMAAGAHHVRFTGVRFGVKPGVHCKNIVYLRLDVGMSTAANHGHDIIFDRCIVTGNPGENCVRGIRLDSYASAVINSRVEEIHEVGTETQAIAVIDSLGPLLIENNYLAGATENIMIGGDPPSVSGRVPQDITVRRNHLHKPLSWNPADGTYAHQHWSVKNLFEVKFGERILVEENVMENNWADAQIGYAVVVKSVNQGGTPWVYTKDVTIRRNKVLNSIAGFSLSGNPEANPVAAPASRVEAYENLCVLGDPTLLNGTSAYQRGIQLSDNLSDVRLRHNTLVGIGFCSVLCIGPDWQRLDLSDNVLRFGSYGCVMGGGDQTPPGANEGTDVLDTYLLPGYIFAGNAVTTGGTLSSAKRATFPASCPVVENVPESSVFVDRAGGNYALALAALKGKATDGRDPGCDTAALDAATAGVRS